MKQHCKIQKKTQTGTKRDMLTNGIALFFEFESQKLNSKVKTTISYLPISVTKFTCLSIVATETFNYTIFGT